MLGRAGWRHAQRRLWKVCSIGAASEGRRRSALAEVTGLWGSRPADWSVTRFSHSAPLSPQYRTNVLHQNLESKVPRGERQRRSLCGVEDEQWVAMTWEGAPWGRLVPIIEQLCARPRVVPDRPEDGIEPAPESRPPSPHQTCPHWSEEVAGDVRITVSSNSTATGPTSSMGVPGTTQSLDRNDTEHQQRGVSEVEKGRCRVRKTHRESGAAGVTDCGSASDGTAGFSSGGFSRASFLEELAVRGPQPDASTPPGAPSGLPKAGPGVRYLERQTMSGSAYPVLRALAPERHNARPR